jgi:hypothetical protein
MNYLNFHTGRPRFHFEGEPPPPTLPTPPPTPPWHSGTDAEIIGHWQNKGWNIEDPKAVAMAATKQARELEKHFGVPADRLLRLPAADAKPEEQAAFWQKLGAPADPKDYDFSAIKYAGKDLEADFADAMRAGLAAAFVPKDKASAIVASVVKFREQAEAAEETVRAGKVATEKAALDQNWGPKKDFNHLQAMEGARKSGISAEAVKAMEGQIGYASVMEHFRKIGAGMSEASFHEGGGDGGVNTREGAVARLAELESDKAWGKRFKAGDAAAKAEWTSLTTLANGEA